MKKLYVGMSGGVDSSVTAALLKEDYQVTGVYMKNWTQGFPGFVCPWRQDYNDAASVAAQLGIPLKVFDFESEYKARVVDYMVAEYRAGRTPNPDIMCNQEIKFKLFLEAALADGADGIATGHYAEVADGKLFTGVDSNKDQSYFLYRVTEAALSRSVMPLGGMEKTETRRLADEFGLVTANKKDSQGICFVGEVGIKEFLSQYLEAEPGPVKTRGGKVLGEHDGAVYYTIGQRHGLGIGGGLPYYVIGKDMETNTVYVTNDLNDFDLKADSFTIADLHWINRPPETSMECLVRTRYRGPLVPGTITVNDGRATIKLEQKERAITPGQSAVLYERTDKRPESNQLRVVGGGIITA